MKYILILMFWSNSNGGTSLDHIEFNSLKDCKTAGEQFYEVKRFATFRDYICVEKSN